MQLNRLERAGLLAGLIAGLIAGGVWAQEAPEPARAAASAAAAQEIPPAPSEFIRFVPVDDDEGRLETAVTTYTGPKGVEIELIGAVHIADAAHYAELQELFRRYDALLYEMVGDPVELQSPSAEVVGGGLLGAFQRMLKNGLGLEFQLDAIDYRQANFVHADLTRAEFRASMEERGESLITLMLDLMVRQHLSAQDAASTGAGEPGAAAPQVEIDIVAAAQRGRGRHALRMLIARQLEGIEEMATAGIGGSTLLEVRNQRALEVAQEQIELGKLRLGIYYGVAHLAGIEQALIEDLGFRKTDHRWLVAWDMSKPAGGQDGTAAPESPRGWVFR